jgi:hypothetical protein
LLMSEGLSPCTVRWKGYTTLQISQHKEAELTRKSRAECVTLAKIQGKQVAKLRSNDYVYHRNMSVP